MTDQTAGTPAARSAVSVKPMTRTAALERTNQQDNEPSGRRGLGLDLITVAAGAGLFVAAALVGWDLIDENVRLFMWFPPLLASWYPHFGPGSVVSIVAAALVVLYGPTVAHRLRWRTLLLTGWAASVTWTTSLALVDGFQQGIAGPLARKKEYLNDVPRVADIPRMLAEFAEHIRTDGPNPWTMHVGAHPPGSFLLFVWLDRLGLGGGAAAGFFCILVGGSACVAVAVTLRALGAETSARGLLPFGVLLPGVVWIGVSADGMFAGVLAWGVALLALGATGGRWAGIPALAGGVLLGYTLYLSYGLVLAGLIPLAVLVLAGRWSALLLGALGVVAVVGAFTAGGFWWLDGFEHLRFVYADSVAKTRPDWYFWWANLAALTVVLGPATLAGMRRLAGNPRRVPALAALAGAALLAVLIADLSGMSKGEVERIWLPFAVWLVLPCALLPRPQVRGWLAAQALLALLVGHLLYTPW